MSATQHIAVLGAGPAGAAVAIGLIRLGYRVSVLSEMHRFEAIEGSSMRVLDGLRHAGLVQAAATAMEPTPRLVEWNGVRRTPNAEHLLDRRRFDLALLSDLTAAGVEVCQARVQSVRKVDAQYDIQVESSDGVSNVRCDFLVEARGRLAPQDGRRERGPETLSLLHQWRGQGGPVGSAVESLPDGWAWMARLPDGRCYWQWTLDVGSTTLPPRAELDRFCDARRTRGLTAEFFGADAGLPATVFARNSTAILSAESGSDRWLRVGDAAMAVDPLSGNGIFQSLSSALQAPAVIHTLLSDPEHAELALRFHRDRIAHLFQRFARIGRDFYAMEERWAELPFWAIRRQWPQQAADSEVVERAVVRKAAVLAGDRIREAEVVVTPEHPMGIWHLDGIEVATLVRSLQQDPKAPVLDQVPPSHRPMVQAWLAQQGF